MNDRPFKTEHVHHRIVTSADGTAIDFFETSSPFPAHGIVKGAGKDFSGPGRDHQAAKRVQPSLNCLGVAERVAIEVVSSVATEKAFDDDGEGLNVDSQLGNRYSAIRVHKVLHLEPGAQWVIATATGSTDSHFTIGENRKWLGHADWCSSERDRPRC
jgi:hypothetical protein